MSKWIQRKGCFGHRHYISKDKREREREREQAKVYYNLQVGKAMN